MSLIAFNRKKLCFMHLVNNWKFNMCKLLDPTVWKMEIKKNIEMFWLNESECERPRDQFTVLAFIFYFDLIYFDFFWEGGVHLVLIS